MLFTVAAAGLSPRSEDRDEARSTHQLPPTRSISTQTRQQFQSRKRPYEENRGRGYFEHREDRRGRSPQPPAEEDEPQSPRDPGSLCLVAPRGLSGPQTAGFRKEREGDRQASMQGQDRKLHHHLCSHPIGQNSVCMAIPGHRNCWEM